MALNLRDDITDNVNLASKLEEEELHKIGTQVVEGFNADDASRSDWKRNLEDWTKLALQVAEKKTFPWENASNVKFPIVSTAAMQFAARAYPTLVPSDGKIVKCRTVGSDPTGEKNARAIRISKHMSFQILDEMEEWEEEMDKLLLALPIAGTVFKKTYYDSDLGRNKSILVMPNDLVVNYWAKDLETCERITQIIEMSKRRITEKMRSGIYLDIDLPDPEVNDKHRSKVNPSGQTVSEQDTTTPYILLEQHCFLDLDDDGYPEPYVVVVELQSKQVLRIVPRFTTEDVIVDEDEKVIKITPQEYFTKYDFFPNPDGGFYGIGFGRLLGPINASVDTIINQLIDAGTLSNLQAGFIGKGLRIKMGDTKFKPGEWKAVNATGQDIKQQIFPLPVREPSAVLFKLLELLIQSSKELASVAEIFVGKMPGQNTPATTTMASIEQGMKLFTAVYKRVYRSLTQEFRKIYKLNSQYLDVEVEMDILDEPIKQSDYTGPEKDIVPAADPNASSQQERMQKAQSLTQLLPLGTINPMEVTQRILTAMEEPNPEKLLMQPQPQQDPKQVEMQMKAELEQAKMNHQIEVDRIKLGMQQAAEEQKLRMKEEMHRVDMQWKEQEAILKARIAQLEAGTRQAAHQQSLQQSDDNHRMNLAQKAEASKQEAKKPKK